MADLAAMGWQSYLSSEIDLGHALLLIILAAIWAVWKYFDTHGGRARAGGDCAAGGDAPICKKDLDILRAEMKADTTEAVTTLGKEMSGALTKHNDENNAAFAAADKKMSEGFAAAEAKSEKMFLRVHERIDEFMNSKGGGSRPTSD